MHFVDGLVGQVLDDLRRRKLLDDLVVLITSDHGMEFDENGLGFSGHGTSYSDYQMHTPLVLRWPGRPTGLIERRTSHNDLAPTLRLRALRLHQPARPTTRAATTSTPTRRGAGSSRRATPSSPSWSPTG